MSEKSTESVPRSDLGSLSVNSTKELLATRIGEQNGALSHALRKLIYEHKIMLCRRITEF